MLLRGTLLTGVLGGAVKRMRRVAKAADLILHRLGGGAVLIDTERQGFGAVADGDVGGARETLQCVFDLDGTGAAIHAFNAQLELTRVGNWPVADWHGVTWIPVRRQPIWT